MSASNWALSKTPLKALVFNLWTENFVAHVVHEAPLFFLVSFELQKCLLVHEGGQQRQRFVHLRTHLDVRRIKFLFTAVC